MSRSAIAILSTENLLHNLTVLKKAAPRSKVIAMVKANAYGHGLRSVSIRLDPYIDMLGVASLDEALALRKIGVKVPILLAEGVFEPSELSVAASENCHVVFHHETQLEWLEKSTLPLPLQAWIKINTGMGRLGFNLEQAYTYYNRLASNPQIQKPLRMISHFACADEKDNPLNTTQIKNFKALTRSLQTEFSFCNSAAIFNFPACHYEFIRPGLALYGVSPLKGIYASALNLKPVMTLQTRLISIQKMPKDAYVGYNARYQCPEEMPVGIVAFGYGDGYPLTAQDGTPVLINQKICTLIGRVSMDMMALDLRNCPTAQIGDLVTLWGEGLPIEEVAEHTSNISWDMLTGIQHRVKFFWTSPETTNAI